MTTHKRTIELDTGETCKVHVYRQDATWRVEASTHSFPSTTGDTPEDALAAFVTKNQARIKAANEPVPATGSGDNFTWTTE